MSDPLIDPALLARLDQGAAALSDPELVGPSRAFMTAAVDYYVALVASGLPHDQTVGCMAGQMAGLLVLLSGGTLQ